MTAEIVLNIVKDLRKLAASIEKLAKEKSTQPNGRKDAEREITLETVRAKLAALMQNGKQAEVKALLQKHGGERLSDIPEENYPALLSDAEGV
ncbi:MAG TPA: rRNA biogenesis protein rrp5 [Firmicutes bacterium]|nr:rRNA biogenesis protein rrp5 [Bacillota bacterium]